jgi:Tol biopolymer transport system component
VKDANTQAGNGGDGSVISADGRSVAFVSSTELGDLKTGGTPSIYVRDLISQKTVLISRGKPPPPSSSSPQIPGEPGLRSGRLLDLNAPAKRAMQAAREVSPNGPSFQPSISADGRYVAFMTLASNIVGDFGRFERKIVVCDRDPGNTGRFDQSNPDGSRIQVCVLASGQTEGNTKVTEPKLSADANRVVWQETRVFSEDVSYQLKTAVLKTSDGKLAQPATIANVPADLGENVSLEDQFDPTISGDGNHIIMHATYFEHCDCDGRFHAIISTDINTGVATRVDIDGNNALSSSHGEFVMRPATSFDGTVIAFVFEQFRFDDERGIWVSDGDRPDVYVVRVKYGQPATITGTEIVSRNNNNQQINGERPALSADGRYLAFVTDSLNAHDGDDGPRRSNSCFNPPPPPPTIELRSGPQLRLSAGRQGPRDIRTDCQVVLRNLVVDQERRVSGAARLPGTLVSPNRDNGNAGNGNTIPDRGSSAAPPSLTEDGGRIAYDSSASDLVQGDTNQQDDVFVRTLDPGLSARAQDFGQVQIGEAAARTAEILETGAGPLVIESVSVVGPNASEFTVLGQTCVGEPLHQTKKCEATIQFKPTAEGDRRAQLAIRVRGGRIFNVDLRGAGTPQPVPGGPVFSVEPSSLNFGGRLLLSNGSEAAVTVTNQGESPLNISAVTIVGPGSPGDYSIASNTCATAVAAKATCRVAVKFSPKLPGTRDAVLQFTDNAPGGPQHLVALKGSGNQPVLEVNPGVTPPGRAVTVTGKQFPPGKTVVVKFDGRVGQASVVAGADGSFRVPLLVYPKATPETRSVLGTVDGFAEPLAKTPLLIVFATVSPAEFVIRN